MAGMPSAPELGTALQRQWVGREVSGTLEATAPLRARRTIIGAVSSVFPVSVSMDLMSDLNYSPSYVEFLFLAATIKWKKGISTTLINEAL